MSGILHMLMSMFRLGATITIGTDSTLYGYYTGLFGSLSANAFEGKTVNAIHWNISATGALTLRLNGTSIANTDATFSSIRVDTATFLRSAASYTANDGAGNTTWTWSVNTSGYSTSGSAVFAVS